MVEELLRIGVEQVRVFSRDEEKQDAQRVTLSDGRVRFYIGDIRDRSSVDYAMHGVNYVFHAAALKQVPSCDFFPMEAVKTNIIGSENVIKSAIQAGVDSVVCLSTDKAVFPVNSMGMSKALMERVAQAAARELGDEGGTCIACVRYGNVMYSRGSVIPLFSRLLREDRPITITEPSMTRFLMPLRDSVDLVKYALTHANQGDLFIKKAPAASIATLVAALKNLFGKPDHEERIIGWRHGEKLYETLASAQELANGEDRGDYWRIRMDDRDLNYGKYFDEGDRATVEQEDLHSHNAPQMTVAEVEDLLFSLPEIQRDLAGIR